MTIVMQSGRGRVVMLGLLALTLNACASVVAERGFSHVEAITTASLGKDVSWVRTKEDADAVNRRIEALTAAPLTVDAAVQIALLNNKGLQAEYAELGLAAASMVAALTPPNPSFSYSKVRGSGGAFEIERQITTDVLGILVLPFAATIEDRRWEQAKLRTADRVLRLAADTRNAFYEAVAAKQLATYADQVRTSAEAGAQLSQQLGRTGAFSKVAQSRSTVFYAEAMAQVVRARQTAFSKRERLFRLLGVWNNTSAITLPDRLPDLPEHPDDVQNIEARAIGERLDIQMAKREVEALARSYQLTQATRFINVLEGGYYEKVQHNEPKDRGYSISLTIPIFDFGTTKVAQAEQTYMAAANRLAELAVTARSQVRESYEVYRLSYDLARHYETEVVPARKAISDEQVGYYNGMLVSTFELLADSREQIAAVAAAIEAQRDYWIAESELKSQLIGNAAALASGN